MLGALLGGQHHSSSHAIDVFNGRIEAQPAALRRARVWLEAQAAEPSISNSLQILPGPAFARCNSASPSFRHHGLRDAQDIRLAQLNIRLKTARPDERVIDIAFDLGFTHLSRMASAYRAKFGGSPSATLRKLS
jgi:hypothetical protein